MKDDVVGWTNLQRFSEAYQRIRVAFVDSARAEPEVFATRLANLLKMNAANKQFGHNLERYY